MSHSQYNPPDLFDGKQFAEGILESPPIQEIPRARSSLVHGDASQQLSEPGPILKCMADIQSQPVPWLWQNRLPMGRISLLVGRPGEGKSFLTCDIAARVSTGTPFPDGAPCQQGSVLFLTAEDDPSDTIRPRLDVQRADVKHIHLLEGERYNDGKTTRERSISLADICTIEQALDRLQNCKLVVVDPIGSFLGVGVDAHRDNEVRAVLSPLDSLARQFGPAVLIVAHRRKGIGTNADDTALGSRAFTGIARAVWHLSRDQETRTRRLFLPGKCNLAGEMFGLAFTITPESGKLEWEADPVNMSADDAIATETQTHQSRRGPDPNARSAAESWLEAALKDGPSLAEDLTSEWTIQKGGSLRTLNRAKSNLGVKSFRAEVPGPWWWRLPIKDAGAADDLPLGDLGILSNSAAKRP